MGTITTSDCMNVVHIFSIVDVRREGPFAFVTPLHRMRLPPERPYYSRNWYARFK